MGGSWNFIAMYVKLWQNVIAVPGMINRVAGPEAFTY